MKYSIVDFNFIEVLGDDFTELKYLNTFRTIADSGSFSAAAERLHYTQSTITFQVNQLEQEFGIKLFEKIGRKMVLTEAGEQLIPYADEVLKSVDRLQGFSNELTEFKSDLRIGVAETVLCYKLPKMLKEFHRRAPKTRLLLRSMNCYEIRNELINGGLDIGIFYRDVGGFGTSLTTYEFGSYPVILTASPETKKQYSDFVTADRKIGIPLIINEPNCIFRQIFEDYLRSNSIILDHTIELCSIPTIKNLVKSDVGVTFLPEFAVREELESGELVEIPTGMSERKITAVCAHHKNKWLSPSMRLFAELCNSQMYN